MLAGVLLRRRGGAQSAKQLLRVLLAALASRMRSGFGAAKLRTDMRFARRCSRTRSGRVGSTAASTVAQVHGKGIRAC